MSILGKNNRNYKKANNNNNNDIQFVVSRFVKLKLFFFPSRFDSPTSMKLLKEVMVKE